MYNLPHLLGVAGSHGPGSPRRGRARSGRRRDGACTLARGAVRLRLHVRTRAHTRAHPQVCARAHPRACAPGVRTAVLTGVRTGRRPQRRPTSSLAVEPHGSHPLLRLTFAPAPRCARRTALEDHRPSPRARRRLHAFALLLHLSWRFPLSLLLAVVLCSRLPSVLSVPPDPCSIRSPIVLSASACCRS